MYGARKTAETRRVAEERWHKVDTAGIDDVRVLSELGLPAVNDRVLAELASVARKRGSECTTIVLELVRVIRVLRDVVAQITGIVRR